MRSGTIQSLYSNWLLTAGNDHVLLLQPVLSPGRWKEWISREFLFELPVGGREVSLKR